MRIITKFSFRTKETSKILNNTVQSSLISSFKYSNRLTIPQTTKWYQKTKQIDSISSNLDKISTKDPTNPSKKDTTNHGPHAKY